MISLSNPQSSPDDPFVTTVRLSELLSLIWTYNHNKNMDNGLVLDSDLGRRIQQLDTAEQHCHVEFPPERPKICNLYGIKDWKSSVERHYKLRKQSEFERRDKDHKQDCILKIMEKMKENPLGAMLEDEQRKVLAHQIVYKGNLHAAKQFGVEELMYKGEINI